MFWLEHQRWEEQLEEEEDISGFVSWKHADVLCGKTNGIIRGQSQLRREKEARARSYSWRKRAYCGLKEIFKINPASDTLVKIRPRTAEENVEVRDAEGRERSETGGGGEDQMETYRVKGERPVCARRGFHLSLQT